MISRGYGTFAGGIDLPDDKLATMGMSIQSCLRPPRLVVPLVYASARPAQVVVQTGQVVRAAQTLAVGDAGGVDVFSPLDGKVGEMTIAQVATAEAFVSAPALEVFPLDEPASPPLAAATPFDWRAATPADLREHLAAGMLTTHRPTCQPLRAWVSQALGAHCRELIANAMENQPYVTADHRLLVEQGPEILEGLAILAKAIEVPQVMLAADQRRIWDYSELMAAGKNHRVLMIALPHKYPIGADPLLVKVLTHRETPAAQGTMRVGSAVIDVSTCLAVQRWIRQGQRCLGRVVTVSGELAPGKANIVVPLGTPCRHLMPGVSDICHGGTMVALRCPPDSVVTPATDALLALAPLAPARPTPCIRCAWCTDHCPARLNVSALNDAFELGLLERAGRLGAQACMGCGICSYVCPARLPLSERVKRLRRLLCPEAKTEVLAVAPVAPLAKEAK